MFSREHLTEFVERVANSGTGLLERFLEPIANG